MGKNHPDYGIYLNNLALLYNDMGDYQKALPIFLEDLKNTEKSLGKNNSSYGISLNNLASLYQLMGDYKKALPLFVEALENTEKSVGKNNSSYGKRLNNLALLYEDMHDYQKALPLFLEALENTEKNFGENHPNYGTSLNSLASVYHCMNYYQKALPFYLQALENAEKNLGKNHPDYGIRLSNLAVLYKEMGNYQKALPLSIEALENTEKCVGKNHPDYSLQLNNLACFYYEIGDYKKALPYVMESNQNLLIQIERIFNFRSEKEKKIFLETIFFRFNIYQSIGINKDNPLTEFTEMNLNNQLILKGLLLNSSKDIFGKLASLNNLEINEKINTSQKLKSQLSFQYSLPVDKHTKNIDSLSVSVNNAEVDLIKEYTSRFPNSNKLKKDWKEIQLKLKKNEVAIEFSCFQYHNRKWPTDSIFYAAYLFKKEWAHPKVVYLFEKKQLTALLNKKSPDQLYASRGTIAIKTNNVAVYRDSIYALVWKPLEQYVSDVKTIYYAPDGLLHQLPFAALGPKEGKLLSGQYNLVQLSSTANLTEAAKEPQTNSSLLIGGIVYDFDPKNKQEVSEKQISYLDMETLKTSKSNPSAGETWNYLSGTKKETDDIKLVYNTNKKNYQSLSGIDATEENFKKLSGKSPTILHIATHGFFFENRSNNKSIVTENPTENQYKLAEDPLLRSGLIFAGANYAWKNGSNPYAKEDGILTALEISNLDLSNTDIVVLSACETGLGDMDGSEGVYGLQRAFKMAGVRYIVMSLWQVPDVETAEFMELFYSHWLGGKELRTAFNMAQKTMQIKYANEPLKWAAFVLFE